MRKIRMIAAVLAVCMLAAGCTAQPLAGILESSTAPETTRLVIEKPDDAAVENAFAKAIEVYGWFDLCSLDVDFDDSVEYGGRDYYRVVSDAVPSYDALRTLVFNLFDTETGEQLLREDSGAPPYIDVADALYGQDFARGSDITKGDYTLSVEWESDTCALCRVQVETLEYGGTLNSGYRHVTGHTDYTFHYALVGTRWVFTDFQLFY